MRIFLFVKLRLENLHPVNYNILLTWSTMVFMLLKQDQWETLMM